MYFEKSMRAVTINCESTLPGLIKAIHTKTYGILRHGISLSEDQLRRKFKKLGLKRRGESVASPLDEVEAAIEVFNITKHWQEIRDPGRDQTTGV